MEKKAAVIKHKLAFRCLSHDDVLSDEFFPYLTKYTKKYDGLLSRNNINSTNNTWNKELVSNKIILHIKDTELPGPDTVFVVGELETMYLGILDGHGIVWSTHVPRFAELLLGGFQDYSKGCQATS